MNAGRRTALLRWGGGALLVITATGLGLLAYRYAPQLSTAAEVRTALDPTCSLAHRECSAEVPGGGRIRLAITPRPIPVMETIRIEVTAEDLRARSATVDFSGVDMNMGFNRYSLTPAGGGRFGGVGVLPVCSRQRMAWEATVLVETPEGRIAAPFRFETVRP